MTWPINEEKIIDGKPINDTFVENLIFAHGISSTMNIKFLQIKYKFPNGFTYRNLKESFNIVKRTAQRWVKQMKEIGMLEMVPNSNVTHVKYRIKDDF